MASEQYILIKTKKTEDIIYIDYKNMAGFKVKPKNVKKYGVVDVNEMIIIKPAFIDRVLKRKAGKKLENYINYLIEVLDDDDADGAKLAQTLNDIVRYRTTINNTYRKYLDSKYLEILLRKLNLIEEKLNDKMQLFYQRMQKQIEEKIKEEQMRNIKMQQLYEQDEIKGRRSK